MKPFFITFEGPEGSGKTTQAQKLFTYFIEKKMDVLYTREPGGNTKIGEIIRRVLLSPKNIGLVREAELFLYMADRAQHVHEVIRPGLTAGRNVICDRYIDASLAYQGYGRNYSLERVRTLNKWATESLYPNKTFLMDIDVALGMSRLDIEKDRMEIEALEFHQKVRDGYLLEARNDPQRFVIIDASKSTDKIHQEIVASLDSLIPS